MDEGIPRLQDRQLHHADFLGVEYSSLYMCKSKRGMKRDESKEAYKLPHRLIEKKRRDRINECIAQLKDLLPEHLKLTTLGHLEKAVVLELTLKHLKSLTAVSEQQHQKIIALQNGDRSMKSSIQTDLDAFHSGFQTCAKEVLQYLNRFENWTPREQRCAQLINHLHKVSAQFLPSAQLLSQQISAPVHDHNSQKLETQTNCVPVIQRTHNGELNENDTDTDSGYGGEAEKCEGKHNNEYNSGKPQVLKNVRVKQEFGDDHPAKKIKMESPGTARVNLDSASRPDQSLINSLVGLGGVPFGQQTPFCLPFYFISPSAAAAYMPFLDKANLEKYFYPAAAAAAAAAAATSPFPLMYPGIPAQAAAATAAVFPGLSAALTPDKVCASSAMLSQRAVSSPSPRSAMRAGSSSSAENELTFDSESLHESDNDET
ncbi:class E basic helix-loop-helix protein 41-like [Acipenser ruthenus]|uniref:class E basic helix-loop-helix protein 41-like n=1 Tax=Acipenser ruthenus TaxID=7906 RepID=UPI002740A501|nr:class E basic helix-loop-helix protein 41-like [Acipenser ruthenus]